MKPISNKLYLFLMGLGVCASAAFAQFSGTFTPTGNLPTPSPWSGTLLPNDKVLFLIDGNGNTGQVAANELYDPGTGTFTATGERTTFDGYSATLLPNGKVLIAETWARGADGHFSLGHAELYDPDTGTFTRTGDMTAARVGGSATLLSNGKVLIAGGWEIQANSSEADGASAELYDPSTGTFTATGDMHEPLSDTATLLPNGKVLITRSYVYDYSEQRYNLVRHAELYDPSTGTFAFTGNMATDQSGRPTATLLTNGKVLLAGGAIGDCLDDDCLPTALAELYDPATGVFTVTGSMTEARGEQTATLLSDGRVLITGGGLIADTSAEIYDPVTGIFSATGNMLVGSSRLATLLNSGKVLIVSGGGSNFSSAELYNPSVLMPRPALLSLSGNGQGQGAIQHAGTTRIASADDPAVAGDYLSIYLTGLADGSAIAPQVAIGGRLAEITFFGNVPGYPGLDVINVRMPAGVAPGPTVPVRLTYLSRTSNQVTIGVQ